MKVTVGDVTNNKVNIRDYMSVDEETGRICVQGEELDRVLIDKSKEWDELKKENARLREALEFYAHKHNYAYSVLEDNIPKVNLDGGEKARQALKE